MRITGGRAKGISLKSPKGQVTRPAADAIREALFSSLSSRVIESRVLDLFAGTGAYGLEALSRGASQLGFVEMNYRAVDCIKENLRRVKKSFDSRSVEVNIQCGDVFKAKSMALVEWDLLIADPPYSDIPSVEQKLFELADGLLAPDGLLILEHPADQSFPSTSWVEIKRLGKKRGRGPAISIFRRT